MKRFLQPTCSARLPFRPQAQARRSYARTLLDSREVDPTLDVPTASAPSRNSFHWPRTARRKIGWLGIAIAFEFLGLSGCTTFKTKLPTLASLTPDTQAVATAPIQAEPPQPVDPEAELETQFKVCMEIARLAAERGMDDEALHQYTQARSLKPEAKGLAHPLAVLHDRAGRADAAMREYERALKEAPRDADVLCDYGYFLYSRGDLEAAESKLRQALARNKEHRQAQINLATVMGTRGDFVEAEEWFSRAIGPAAAKHNVGMLKLRSGDRQAACVDLQAAAVADPSLQRTREVLSWVGQPF